jgi:hypothetical protein
MRVPVELPTRSWRAPTLNESAYTFKQPSLPTVKDILQITDEDVLTNAIREMKGKRFLLLRPCVKLVTVVQVHPAPNQAHLAQPHTSHEEINMFELHLSVTYKADGESFQQTRPISWFRANSRPAATSKSL